jgi:hypothetical protein
MSSKSTIALAVAILLSTVSVAMSAPKHPVVPVLHRHETVAKRHVPPATYQSFGSVPSNVQPREPDYMRFQDRGLRDSQG